jgi:hypothetical protein
MKKRSKKYKPKAMKIRLYSWESDRSGSDRFVTAQVKHQFGWVDLSGEASFNAINKKRNWTLIVRAIEQHKDKKVDIYPVIAHFRDVTLKDLELEAKKMRKESIQKCNHKNVIDIGWMSISFEGKNPVILDEDVAELGAITEERQMLFNYAWAQEVAEIVGEAA